ncbi:MAG: alpha-amylase family protein [Propionibacteriaceae bacterium]|nr:alpha-amylase family protein [Propionibacteriaceae bacterium]
MNLTHAIWWHLYPLGALGAPIHEHPSADVVHRLPRLVDWLDYAVELGCSGLLLGPVFTSTSHGYDTVDHFTIDPRLGDQSDFDHLVAAAGQRGLAVVLDGVFNHIGAAHPAVTAGEGLVRTENGSPAGWEGHAELVELDHANPAVADLVTEVMLHWLRRGIAGWRLDVAYAVPPEFWREVLGRVRAEFPEAIFIGEVLHGDYAAVARAGGLDSVTQYELWKAAWSSLKDRNFWELAWALERHDAIAAQLVSQTFVGNHDVTRIASQVGDAGSVLALVILLTLPGMPSIYYGDEQGFRGEKGCGRDADDPLRPQLPATPADLAPQGWWLYRLHQELIALRRRNPWLAGGRVRVVGKDCTWITYETTGSAGNVLRVELGLEPEPSARVVVDGTTAFVWPR